MRNKIINKLKSAFTYSFKLFILASFLLSQSFITEIFLYHNDPSSSPISIAKADTSDAWYDTSWIYRKKIIIAGSSSNLSNYQVKLTVNYVSGKMKPDFSDLRFTDPSGTILYSYYIESKTDSVSADLWVKVNSIPTSGTYLYMYYGNSGAVAASSGNDAFPVFDDFNNSAVDPEWTVVNPNGSQTISENSSSVSLRTAASIADLAISTGNQNAPRIIQGITGNFVAETKITTINAYYDLTGILLWKDSQNFFVFGKGMLNGSERIWRRKNIADTLNDTWYGNAYTVATVYLKMVRSGNTLTCYFSDDSHSGVWTQAFSETFNVTDPVSIGFVRFDATSRTYNGTADWFFAGQYASPEPSPTFSAEESYSLSPLSAWSYRKTITIDSSKVSGTSNLANFPVLVNLPADSDLQNHARTDGSDIIFAPSDIAWDTGSQSNQLSYEIENYNNTNGSLQAWVKIPMLYSSNNSPTTTFYMYYGNSSASGNAVANSQGVWDSNYKMVQHMNQDPSGAGAQMKDSTGNGNNGTTAGTMTTEDSVSGKIGKAIDFDAVDDYVDIGTNANLRPTGDMTVEGMVWVNGIHAGDGIVSAHWARNDFTVPYLLSHGNSFAFKLGAGASEIVASGGTVVVNTWFHVVGTISGNNVKLYVNGAEVGNTVFSGTRQTGERVTMGEVGSADGYHQGMIDEVRISSAARSADWISAEYNNQSTTPAAGNFILPLSAEQNNLPSVLTQIAPVPALTNDPTPDYTFNSTKAGTITYGGGCSSSAASAVVGDNTITFNSLADGAHSCTVRVTNPEGNDSNTLSVPSFTIDTDSPSAFTLLSPLSNASISVMTPSFSWSNSSDTSNIQKYQLYLDGVMDRDGLSLTATTSSGELSCGDHRWNVIAFDNAGNATSSFVSNFNIGCAVGFSQPVKPIISLSDLVNGNIPANIIQIAVSTTPDFKNVSWEDISQREAILKRYIGTNKLCLKFRTKDGAVSDTVTYEKGNSNNPTSSSLPSPTGTLLKLPNSPRVYVIIEGKKKWISTPEVFEQLGYKWTDIKTITETELNALPDYEDNLIRQIGDYKVYLVVNGTKRHIPNPEVFLDYGFSWSDIREVDKTVMDKYKETFLIKETGKNEIYYTIDGIRKWIPNMEVFNSYTDKMEDVQVISKKEMGFYALSNLIRLNDSNDIYLTEGNIKKHISNPEVFNKYKLNWNFVMSVDQTESNFYRNGGELK